MPRKDESTTKKDCDTKSQKGKTKGKNHPEWYTRESLNHQVGLNFAALTSVEPLYEVEDVEYRVNTAIRIPTVPALHIDENDSIDRMTSHLYAMIRERNAGAANYNPEYLKSYILLMEYLHAGYYAAVRAVQAVRSKVPGWRDSPYLMTALTGVKSYTEFTSQLANVVNDLDLIGKEIEMLPIPVDMTVFDRIKWLYSNIFVDANTIKGAPLAFVPIIPSEAEILEGGLTRYTVAQLANSGNKFLNGYSVIDMIANMQSLLSTVLENPIFAIMRGDLIKAYGYTVREMRSQLMQPLNVVYDEWALAQIQNANVPMLQQIAAGSDEPGLNMFTTEYTNPGALAAFRATFVTDAKQRCTESEYFVQAPEGADLGYTLAVTRFMQRYDPDTRNIKACNGDLILGLDVITEVSESDPPVFVTLADLYAGALSTTQSTAIGNLVTLGWLNSMFNYMPLVYTTKRGGNNGEISGTAFSWNVDNWATMSEAQLEQFDEIAIRSMFYSNAPRAVTKH